MEKHFFKHIWFPILITILALIGSISVFNYVSSSTKQTNIDSANALANSKLNRIKNDVDVLVDRGELNVALYEEYPERRSQFFETCASYIIETSTYVNFVALYDSNGDLMYQKNDSIGLCNHNIIDNAITKDEVNIISNHDDISSFISKVYTFKGVEFFYIIQKVQFNENDIGYYTIAINLENFLNSVQMYSLKKLGYEYRFVVTYDDFNVDNVLSEDVKNDKKESTTMEYNENYETFKLVLFSPDNFYNHQSRTLAATLLSIVVIVLIALSFNISLVMNQSDFYKKESRIDGLTHISNEKGELIRLMELEKNNKPYLFFYIDINFFKEVNDNFGHDAGDEMLQKLARLLNLSVNTEDLVSRIHGDEFSIIMQGEYSNNHAEEIKNAILEVINTDVSINGKKIPMSVSIGFAIVPNDATRYDDAIKIADKRMYEFKNEAKKKLDPNMYKKL